jgi:hypothetical protein
LILFFFAKRVFESKLEGVLSAAAGQEGNSLPPSDRQYQPLITKADSLCTELANRWECYVKNQIHTKLATSFDNTTGKHNQRLAFVIRSTPNPEEEKKMTGQQRHLPLFLADEEMDVNIRIFMTSP